MATPLRQLAEYYDAEYAHLKMLGQDVPFFVGQLPRGRRQTILELCCGTGRAAIPLAQAGHRVVGIDYARDMVTIAKRKRDSVGLGDRQLALIHGDVCQLSLGRRFDWICIFFNTFLSFTTLAAQDRLLGAIRRHLKPDGRFWLDIFQPDVSLIPNPRLVELDPHAFYVPQLARTVFRVTSLRRIDAQSSHVTFQYTWFDELGRAHRERTEFDLTYLFPRELQVLLERNGLRIETLCGNYDGSPLRLSSPRMIARCCRM